MYKSIFFLHSPKQTLLGDKLFGLKFKPKWSRGKEPRSGVEGLKPTFIEGGLPNDI